MSDLQDWLDERERIQNMPEDGDFEDVDEALALFPRTLAALRNVLELHGPAETGVEYYGQTEPPSCHYCGYWPCDTYKAIQEAINDDE